jgi:manganese efflux pump family protein
VPLGVAPGRHPAGQEPFGDQPGRHAAEPDAEPGPRRRGGPPDAAHQRHHERDQRGLDPSGGQQPWRGPLPLHIGVHPATRLSSYHAEKVNRNRSTRAGSVALVPALLLVALALGLSNFAVAVGLGVAGTGAAARLRVGLVFGLFETGMPLLGLLLGHGLAQDLGHAARWVAAAVLIACGGYALLQTAWPRRTSPPHPTAPGRPGAAGLGAPGLGTGRLLATGLALSVDNLAAGFALGTYHTGLVLAVAVIGAVSVTLSLLGLELGARLGSRTGERGELLAGLVLVAVGVALACGMN